MATDVAVLTAVRCPRCHQPPSRVEVVFRRLKIANGGRPVCVLRHTACGEVFAVVLRMRD